MLQNKLQVFCCPFYAYLYCAFHKHVAWDQAPQLAKKRQKTGSNRKNNGNRSEPSGILGRGKGPPFPHPILSLDSLRWPICFFFSPTPIFYPFSHNAEPGPRLINTRILKFKSQLTFALFVAVNHLSDLVGNRGLHLVDFDPFCVLLCFKVRCL